MKKLLILFLITSTAALAQAPSRVRGTITAVDGGGFTVDGKTQVLLGEKTEIVFTQPIALAEIKPGDFLAITSRKDADGKLTAYDVRRFPKPLNPGHRPFDGRDDQTMTNATGGAQKIVVPEGASVSTLVPGSRAQLVKGAQVNVTMDKDRMAIRLQVSPPK